MDVYLNVKALKNVYNFVLKYLNQLIITPTMAKISHLRKIDIIVKISDVCAPPAIEVK